MLVRGVQVFALVQDLAGKGSTNIRCTCTDAQGNTTTHEVSGTFAFTTPIQLTWNTEQEQTLNFTVDKQGDTFHATCSLANVMNNCRDFKLPLIAQDHSMKFSSRSSPVLVLVSEELASPSSRQLPQSSFETVEVEETVILHLSARHLPKKEWGPFNPGDPFLSIYREIHADVHVCVYHTAPSRGTTEPDWGEAHLPLSVLVNNNLECTLVFQCHWHNSSGNHDFIGSAEATLSTLLSEANFNSLSRPTESSTTVSFDGKIVSRTSPTSSSSSSSSSSNRPTDSSSVVLPSETLHNEITSREIGSHLAVLQGDPSAGVLPEQASVQTTSTEEAWRNDAYDVPCILQLQNLKRMSQKQRKQKVYDGEGEVLVGVLALKRATQVVMQLEQQRKAHTERCISRSKELTDDGASVGLLFALDYSSSNSHPTDLNSLHFSRVLYKKMLDAGKWNCDVCTLTNRDPATSCEACQAPRKSLTQGTLPTSEYDRAIKIVHAELAPIVQDRSIGMWQFAGVVKPQIRSLCRRFAGKICDDYCFPLNLKTSSPTVSGLEGALGVYAQSWEFMDLSGPTHFVPVIDRIVQFSKSVHATCPLSYHIVVIVCDGPMDDVKETQAKLVETAQMPLSFVFIGVGNADFTPLSTLISELKLAVPVARRGMFKYFHSSQASSNLQALVSGFPTELVAALDPALFE